VPYEQALVQAGDPHGAAAGRHAEADAARTAEGAEEVTPTNNGLQILLGLNRTGKHIYGGTVPYAETQRRRKANKTARASRRTNRRRSS
jgi:hypothetical protein